MIRLLIWLVTRKGDFYRTYRVGKKIYELSAREYKTVEQQFREMDNALCKQGTSLKKEFGFTPDDY